MKINWRRKGCQTPFQSLRLVELTLGFVTLGGFLSIGCAGMTGSTNFMTLTVDRKIITEPLAEVRVASVEIEPNAAFLRSVGSYAVGQFDGQDLKVLRTSLQNSISSLQTLGQADPKNKLDLHVLLRHHMVAHSNNEGAVLAAVTWCLANESEAVMFHEGFFASESGRHTVTLGAVKDAVNESIIRRIIETTAYVASRREQNSIQPGRFPKTYTSYEEALTDLPHTLSSTFLFVTAVGPEKVEWGWPSGTPVDIDWERYLSERRK